MDDILLSPFKENLSGLADLLPGTFNFYYHYLFIYFSGRGEVFFSLATFNTERVIYASDCQ